MSLADANIQCNKIFVLFQVNEKAVIDEENSFTVYHAFFITFPTIILHRALFRPNIEFTVSSRSTDER